MPKRRRPGTRYHWFVILIVLTSTASCARTETESALPFLTLDSVVPLATTSALAEVRDLTLLPRGEVWALNSLEPLFVAFSPNGEVRREFGARGGGPHEFGLPTTFVTGNADGEAWIFDAERHALIEVSSGATNRNELALPRDGLLAQTNLFGGRELIGAGLRTARLGDEVLFAASPPNVDGGLLSFWRAIWSAELIALHRDHGSVRGVVSLARALGEPDGGFTIDGSFPPFPFWFRLWTVCPDEEIRVYDRLTNQVRRFSPAGKPLPGLALPDAPPRSVTATDLARVGFGLGMLQDGGELTTSATPSDSARIIGRLSRQIEGSPEDLDTLLPRYVDMHCSDDGSIWLRVFDVQSGDLGGGRTWIRIAKQGAISEVQLPERFDAYRVFSDRVLGVQRDVWDVPTVAWLVLPPSEQP